METNLAKNMIERAEKDNLPKDHPLYVNALAFEQASLSLFEDESSKISTPKYLAIWAKARRVWCEYTGLPLI
jgi:hypothetical protein